MDTQTLEIEIDEALRDEVARLGQRVLQLEALLRKVRAELARDTAIWEAELINEIDEVVK